MASTETAPSLSKETPVDDLSGVEAGLDALDTVQIQRQPIGQLLRAKALPPLLGVLVVLALWQGAYSLHLTDSYKLPSPLTSGTA